MRSRAVTKAPTVEADYPLGLLLARGILTPDQHDAGCHYAYLAGRVIGRTKPSRVDGADFVKESALAAIERRWHEAVRALLGAGRRAKDEVDNAAIFERTPSWLIRRNPLAGDERERKALIAGLDALAAWRAGRKTP